MPEGDIIHEILKKIDEAKAPEEVSYEDFDMSPEEWKEILEKMEEAGYIEGLKTSPADNAVVVILDGVNITKKGFNYLNY